MSLRCSALAFPVIVASLAVAAEPPARTERVNDEALVRVNVRDFEDRVRDGDWSRAIQAAIDSVNRDNGFHAGGTVFFPAGTYRVDQSIVIGNDPAHWGLRVLGYGATLVGSKKLDKQPLLDPEPEEKDKGVPIFVLKDPAETEGSGYCIEGLRLTRENERSGVGISVPWKEIPKSVTFRSLKIHNQKVGVHITHAWQFSFTDCLFRGNDTGMIIQSHGNNVGIVNCVFRRSHHHGLVIGPDRSSWASNGQHISGSIFEANKGYGILLLSSAQTVITGNYFEANGNSIGVMTPWQTTIDTNLFWGSYGYDWQMTPYSDSAHIVLANARSVQLRNNQYNETWAWFRRSKEPERWEYVSTKEVPKPIRRKDADGPKRDADHEYRKRPCSVLIAGRLYGKGNVFDTLPVVHQDAEIQQKRVAADTGLDYYAYDEQARTFVEKNLIDD